MPFDPRLVFAAGRNEDAGYDLVDEMAALPDPPTAILLIFETLAIGIYRRLAELGKIPGRDLAIIGFRDEPTVRFLVPSLTCFSAPLHDLGEDLARALLSRIPSYAEQFADAPRERLATLELRAGQSG
jgi:DNA-binding LacI/PurR family transcriptional regulator